MKQMLFLVSVILLSHLTTAQGCVAIRNNGAVCTMNGYHFDTQHKTANQQAWTFAVNNRYFKSFRHFVGTEEQKQRVDLGTEVINHVFATEFGLTRSFNNRWSLSFFAPVVSNTRSSLYEHDGKNRYSTHSFGLGDVRLAASYWLTNPNKFSKLNVQVGAGLKLPTGDYKYQDYFYKNDSVKVLGPVDQSIQLGDGGTGFSVEANLFYNLSGTTSFYANGFYLFNPREQNGVSTKRGGVPTATDILYTSDVMSVPDQFMLRAGAMYNAGNFGFSGGMRIEGVPAKDVIGGNNGFRRPGYVISVEPVALYKVKGTQFYLSVPVAIERNRTQSFPDKIRTQKTGIYAQGDAAFADYTINFGAVFSLH